MVVESASGRNKLLQPFLHRDGVLRGGVDGLVAVSARWSGRLAGQVGLGLRVSTASVLTVAVVAVNKAAAISSLLPRLMAVVGGFASSSSCRGWRCGGVDPEEDFVPMLRRRGDARSGVDAELWALYRSVCCSGWSPGQDGRSEDGGSAALAADLEMGVPWPKVVHCFRSRRSSAGDSCSLKAWRYCLSWVQRRLFFFCSAGVVGGAGWKQAMRWFSVGVDDGVAVLVLGSVSERCIPAFVRRIVLSFL